MIRILSLPLFLFSAFCVFGFLASFEPGPHLVYRVGYPVLGVVSAGSGLRLLLRKSPAS